MSLRVFGATALVPVAMMMMSTGCFARSPAAQSPLKEKLASTNSMQLEHMAVSCLKQAGWEVDPYPVNVAGTTKIHAFKKHDLTDVYIYPETMNPRITGGPDWGDNGDPFWSCLTTAPL